MNKFRISEALASVRRLSNVLHEMSDDEILEVVRIEESSARRPSVLTVLKRELRVRARKQAESNVENILEQTK